MKSKTKILMLVSVSFLLIIPSVLSIDINSTQSLQYHSGNVLVFQVDTDGKITAYNSINLQNNSILNFFNDSTACSPGYAVRYINDDGSYICDPVVNQMEDNWVNESGDVMGGDLNLSNHSLVDLNAISCSSQGCLIDSNIANDLTIDAGSLNASILSTGTVPNERLDNIVSLLGQNITSGEIIALNASKVIGQLNDTQIEDDIGANYNKLMNLPTNIDENLTNDVNIGDPFGGEVSGTYDNLILSDSALDDQYITDEEEGNLSVNKSNFWDGLDTVDDITGLFDSQIDDDLTISPGGNISNGALPLSISVSDLTASGSLSIGGGYGSQGLTVDADGNILTNGNLTYSGQTFVIDRMHLNDSAEFPRGIYGGRVYPGNNSRYIQQNSYISSSGSVIKINGGNLDLGTNDLINVNNYNLNENDIPPLTQDWDNYIDAGVLNNLTDLNYGIKLSGQNITNDNWINDSQEGNLDVNSSNYWDDLNTTEDITTLGTVLSGTWNADIVQDSYISNELNLSGLSSINGSSIDSGLVLSSYIEDIWIDENGDTLSGPINMSGNELQDIGNITLDGDMGFTGGNVGIGTTSPGNKLDVVGNINSTGTIYQGGNAVLDVSDEANFNVNSSDFLDGEEGAYYLDDTNETGRFNNLTGTDCLGTDKAIGVDSNGNLVCDADVDTDTQKGTGTVYLYNDSSKIYLNESELNITIDAGDDYEADNYIGDAASHTAGGNLDMNGNIVNNTQVLNLEAAALPVCNSSTEGDIRYNGTAHYGCNGTSWNSLY